MSQHARQTPRTKARGARVCACVAARAFACEAARAATFPPAHPQERAILAAYAAGGRPREPPHVRLREAMAHVSAPRETARAGARARLRMCGRASDRARSRTCDSVASAHTSECEIRAACAAGVRPREQQCDMRQQTSRARACVARVCARLRAHGCEGINYGCRLQLTIKSAATPFFPLPSH